VVLVPLLGVEVVCQLRCLPWRTFRSTAKSRTNAAARRSGEASSAPRSAGATFRGCSVRKRVLMVPPPYQTCFDTDSPTRMSSPRKFRSLRLPSPGVPPVAGRGGIWAGEHPPPPRSLALPAAGLGIIAAP
jgi:hypothetical protein